MRAGGGPGRWRGWDRDQFPFTMRRPPWWPEGEPFPPQRRWRPGRYHWFRFLGCLFLGCLAFALIAGIAAGAMFGHPGGPGPPRPFFLVPVVVVVVLALLAAGAFRRVTGPMDGLIEAARRIEAGDYSATVPEWGSRDIRSVSHAFNSMSARLKKIDEQRRSFLADVTHELRTPLSVIRGQAEAIADGVYPADAAHLAPILDATQALERLVEDLRTLVLTDAGNLALNREPVEIGALVADAADSFRSQAEAAGVELTIDLDGELPATEADPARIRQVIANLLSNAIRHTPPGGRVKVAATADERWLIVSVSDTGGGISPELLPHVFERFVKGPASTGSGLGLAIARDIAMAHGGALEIESTPGQGTLLRLRLPRSHKAP